MEETFVKQPQVEENPQIGNQQEQSEGPGESKVEMSIQEYAEYVHLQELQVRELTALIDLYHKKIEFNNIRNKQNNQNQ